MDRHALPFVTDAGLGHRAAVGLILLATDQTIEHELPRLAGGEGVAFYASRTPMPLTITTDTLRGMEKDITVCASMILPGVPLDVVAFCCTSGAIVIGEQTVRELVWAVRPEVSVTTPITAARAAMEALGVTAPVVVTPYGACINDEIRRYLAAAGYRVAAFETFDQEDDSIIARISADSIRAAVRTAVARAERPDGVFISCTNLRTLPDIAALERELGLPVLSSNQVLAWHIRRLAGLPVDRPDLGRIFSGVG